MVAGWFDELSKVVGAQRTRRGVMKTLGASALAASALGAMGLAGARVGGIAGPVAAQEATPAASPITAAQPAAILVAATNAPLRVPGSDGLDHLEYDLIITNVFVVPVTLTSIDVIAPEGSTVLRLDGETLVSATQPLLAGPVTKEIPASGAVGVVMDVVAPRGQPLARRTHRITYAVAPARWSSP